MRGLDELEGARRKLIRADHHLHALWRELKVFSESDACSIRSETNLGRGGEPFIRCNYFIDRLEPIPHNWSLYVGDVLGNLRSALDHAAWAVVLHQRGVEFAHANRKRIYFPIWPTPEEFAGCFVVQNVSSEAVDAFRESQPYVYGKSDETFRDSLRALQELVNIDKHRELHIAIFKGHQAKVTTQPAIPGGKGEFVHKGPLYVGAKVATFSGLRPESPKVNVQCDLTIEIALEVTPTTPFVPLQVGLREIRLRTRKAIHALKPIVLEDSHNSPPGSSE